MKNFVECIINSEAATGEGSKSEKRSQLELIKDCQISLRLLEEGMSPYRVFGIKKFDKPVSYAETDAHHDDFFNLLDALHNRDLTGNAAKAEVTTVLSCYTENTSTILERVLLKDLKAGFSAETVNEVICGSKKPKENAVVPLFGIMLAGKLDEKKYEWKYPLLAEAKYDGTRALAVSNKGSCSYFSRSGKPSSHLDGLFDEELKRMEELEGEPIVVDGEALASNFTESMNAKGSKNDKAKANLKFYAFDYMTLKDWQAQECKHQQITRSNLLEQLIKESKCEKIIKSEYKICNNYEEVLAFYNEMLAKEFEGLILKDVDGFYEWKRSKSWVKWKPVFTFDGKITGFYLGKEGTSMDTMLGGIYVEGIDENDVLFNCKCGSGFKKPQRIEIWENQENYLGKMVELEAQEMCKSEGSEVHSLRFPVFKKFREDKD